MLSGLNTLLKRRYFKLGVEVVVILVIYLAVKAFMQRDLVDGPVPPLEGMLLDGQRNQWGQTPFAPFIKKTPPGIAGGASLSCFNQ